MMAQRLNPSGVIFHWLNTVLVASIDEMEFIRRPEHLNQVGERVCIHCGLLGKIFFPVAEFADFSIRRFAALNR